MQYTTELALTNVETYSKIYSVAINPAIKAIIECSMLLTGGNQSEAARLLGVSRGTIRHYLRSFFGRFDVGILPNKNYEKLIKRTRMQK
jgi:DNA-binding protein Fis